MAGRVSYQEYVERIYVLRPDLSPDRTLWRVSYSYSEIKAKYEKIKAEVAANPPRIFPNCSKCGVACVSGLGYGVYYCRDCGPVDIRGSK